MNKTQREIIVFFLFVWNLRTFFYQPALFKTLNQIRIEMQNKSYSVKCPAKKQEKRPPTRTMNLHYDGTDISIARNIFKTQPKRRYVWLNGNMYVRGTK